MSIVLGIDPGLSGAIAAINGSNETVKVIPLYLAGKELDVARLGDWIYDTVKKHKVKIACVEKVSAMPKQGSVSMFNFGMSYGAIRAIIVTLLIPMYEVRPQEWKNAILRGTKKDKDAAITYCRNAYPTVSLLRTERSRKADNGMADALCIARYALERYKDVL